MGFAESTGEAVMPRPRVISAPFGTGVEDCGPTARNVPPSITITEYSSGSRPGAAISFAPTIALTPGASFDPQAARNTARNSNARFIRRASPAKANAYRAPADLD